MHRLYHFRKLILLLAAIGNFIGAVIALLFPAWFMEQFFRVPPQAQGTFPYLPMYHYTFWAFVLIMGIGYWITAGTPEKNKAVIFIGGAGKLIASLFWIMLFAQGMGNWLMIGGGVFDLCFGSVLLLLLVAKPKLEVAA
jgi:hypothetical protein